MKKLLGASALALAFTCLSPFTAAAQSIDNAANPNPEGTLSRWLTLDQFSFSSRYRNAFGTNGEHTFNSEQNRSLVSGKFKLDEQGKYFIGFRASSGRYFNWAYSTAMGAHFGPSDETIFVGPGTGGLIYQALSQGVTGDAPESRGWNFYMRELYFSATPVKPVTVEFGGLGFERGVASEITTFDEDGYITGERLRLHDKNHLYFDQISTTFGYLGFYDPYTPNFFARGTGLAHNNYRQVEAHKAWSKRFAGSLEYDWFFGYNTFREALRTSIPETKVADSARFELYQRANAPSLQGEVFPAGNGWSVAFDKNLQHKKWQLEAGYADIDRYYGVYSGSRLGTIVGFSLNGDAYQIGKRPFVRLNYTPHPFVTFFGFYTHEVDAPTDPTYNAFNRQNIQGGLTINFKAMLNKAGLL